MPNSRATQIIREITVIVQQSVVVMKWGILHFILVPIATSWYSQKVVEYVSCTTGSFKTTSSANYSVFIMTTIWFENVIMFLLVRQLWLMWFITNLLCPLAVCPAHLLRNGFLYITFHSHIENVSHNFFMLKCIFYPEWMPRQALYPCFKIQFLVTYTLQPDWSF